jgi:SAM-dependent methyltransferase
LMCRGGAMEVIATDAVDHCREKMAAIRHYYNVDFAFHEVGLMYDLTNKLRKATAASFDLINLSGLLYHVFSPLMVLAGVRALLKKNGLIIVSTNVIKGAALTMELNSEGRLQEETNTFWYVSLGALDYLLRYLKLAPIDCIYLPHQDIHSPVRYLAENVESGYCSIVCRAQDDVLPTTNDRWMKKSASESWEYRDLIDWTFESRQSRSEVRYTAQVESALLRADTQTIHLQKAVDVKTIHRAATLADAHILRLADRS